MRRPSAVGRCEWIWQSVTRRRNTGINRSVFSFFISLPVCLSVLSHSFSPSLSLILSLFKTSFLSSLTDLSKGPCFYCIYLTFSTPFSSSSFFLPFTSSPTLLPSHLCLSTESASHFLLPLLASFAPRDQGLSNSLCAALSPGKEPAGICQGHYTCFAKGSDAQAY